MRKLSGLILAAAVVTAFHADSAQAQDPVKELAGLTNKLGGCSMAKAKIKQYRARYKDYRFAFAARNDNTLTGIKGCGYGIEKSQSKADALAMKNCREWEKTYGTDGGKKVCRLVEF